ncbi:MAG: hypothetical protein LKE39_07110 [Sphaerochaeta sp.]|jgi:spermidine/putrescine transport system substrate-binding protein|nr:hypothetical protein [Sphaerochaeta sp.]
MTARWCLDYFASNEEMYAKLKAAGNGAGYDIIVPSGDYVSIMKAQGHAGEDRSRQVPQLKVHLRPGSGESAV